MRKVWLGLAALAGTASVAVAQSYLVPGGTIRASVTEAGTGPDGPSSRPTISEDGTLVAFESTASNLAPDPNGSMRDVFLRDLVRGRTTLVSAAPRGANGPSDSAVVAGGVGHVAFSSLASNLVGGDTNGVRDVFVRADGSPPVRVSVAMNGDQANGSSFQPDISSDGRRVVFTSLASNLVPGDTNGSEDVFVHDLEVGTTQRVSERAGAGVRGRSRAPSISPDGKWVSFESTSSQLVDGDRNRVPDVFLADLLLREVVRVSVNSRRREQNRAVTPPFVTVSDVSRGGRFVTWDSDATNLVRGDRNRDTDVFVRDVLVGRTTRASRSATRREGDNDSYFPSLSSDGRYVAFSSFAGNLWPQDVRDEDVFVHDRELATTSLVTVTAAGGLRPLEARRQLLRRPALSDGGRRIAFTSTVRLTDEDRDELEDVLVRSTAPPEGRIVSIGSARRGRARYRLQSDDPAARFLCRVDRRRPFFCPRTGRLPRLRPGRHRLLVRAAGPGRLFDPSPSRRLFRVR